MHLGIAGRRRSNAFEIGKEISAGAAFAVGVDEVELQREQPAGRVLVAAAHRFAERRVGGKCRRLIARNRLCL